MSIQSKLLCRVPENGLCYALQKGDCMFDSFQEFQQSQDHIADVIKPLQEPTRYFDDDVRHIYTTGMLNNDAKQALYNPLNLRGHQLISQSQSNSRYLPLALQTPQ
ncbi:hypothetical protein CIPAW_06G065500 [Carya illinoinensis]|uniref:Uncharacterized protein n=1 Tax=Carya illinoinensis TaxID=32201 RepID=A0A8T1Q8R8_CARIL|nr:hypothetical protein CIPAW_06G065500 [Carya illinoinensis]